MKRKEKKGIENKTKTFDDAAFNCKYIFKIYFLTVPVLLLICSHLSAVCALEICINLDFAFEIAQKESENKN